MLGEILVEAGIIDEMQLTAALGEQQRWGRRLGVTLVKMGMVDEGHLVRALARQFDLPIVSLAGRRIAEDVIALVPGLTASEHGVIPLFVERQGNAPSRLYLGMEDPSNLEVLDDLGFRTGLEVRPVMVTPTDLGAAIDLYYHARPEHSDRSREVIGMPSLDRVEGEPAASSETVLMPVQAVAPVAGERVEAPPEPLPSSAGAADLERDLEEEVRASTRVDEALLREVEAAKREAERTRIVAKVLTQLLIEKGLLDLQEVQARIAQHRASAAESGPEKA
jgi:hypothetical protein